MTTEASRNVNALMLMAKRLPEGDWVRIASKRGPAERAWAVLRVKEVSWLTRRRAVRRARNLSHIRQITRRAPAKERDRARERLLEAAVALAVRDLIPADDFQMAWSPFERHIRVDEVTDLAAVVGDRALPLGTAIDDYRLGKSAGAIGRRYGFDRDAVLRRLRTARVRVRKWQRIPDTQTVLKLRAEGWTRSEIAEEFGVSESAVKYHIAKVNG
jgi:DNA-binding CsgD family transcriptional regulator